MLRACVSGTCTMMGGVNRLGTATSPYLLQHADNPVEWWEWGAAFAEALRRGVPVFLSVGYAACHWCHEGRGSRGWCNRVRAW